MVQQHHAHENRSTKALPLSFRIILALARGPRASRMRLRHRCRGCRIRNSIAESAVETRPTSLPPAWMQSSAKVMKKTWMTKTESPRNSQVSAGCKRSTTAAKSRFNAFPTGTSTFPENIDASSL